MDFLLALFRKEKKEETTPFHRDLKKAAGWFAHAQTAADAHNDDYAIECYANGLKHDPDNLAQHQALRRVALRRKVAGGKPAGFLEVLKAQSAGGSVYDKFHRAILLWAKDPLDPDRLLAAMEQAVAVGEAEPELHMGDVVDWMAGLILEAGEVDKKPTKAMYVRLMELLRAVRAYDRAIQACRLALSFSPDDAKLLQELKNLEAEQTMAKGFEESVQVGQGGFVQVVRDLEKQRALEQEDRLSKTEEALDQIIARRRAEYQANPSDMARLNRLVDALVQKNKDETDQEAVEYLRQAWQASGQYALKVRMGNIIMRQMARQLRELKQALEKNPEDTELKQKYAQLSERKLQFELEEYTERVRNYPTDMGMLFELGKRLYAVKKYEEAIAAFQQASSDAKYRIQCLEYLGLCYLAKGWLDEAIGTLRRAIDAYPVPDDRLALDLRYLLMDALESSARKNRSLDQAREAAQIASQIVQTDITFRDVRVRLENLRKLVEELQSQGR